MPRRVVRRSFSFRSALLSTLTLGLLTLTGCDQHAATWDDALLAAAAEHGDAVIAHPAPIRWSRPWTLVQRPNAAIGLVESGTLRPVPPLTALDSTTGLPADTTRYDVAITWVAPGFAKQRYGDAYWERVDCRAGQMGTFLWAAADTAPVVTAEPDVWWPMRPHEAVVLCPTIRPSVRDRSLGVSNDPTGESPFRRAADPEASAALTAWVLARRPMIDSALAVHQARLAPIVDSSEGDELRCPSLETRRIERPVGEASGMCMLWIRTDGAMISRMRMIEIVRPRGESAWRPVVYSGRLKAPWMDDTPGDEDAISSDLESALASALGEPIEYDDWRSVSIEARASTRAAAAGW